LQKFESNNYTAVKKHWNICTC